MDIQIQHDFWISNNVFKDILNIADYWISIVRFLDIHNSILVTSLNIADFWISINRIMDILKYNYGYPKIYLRLSKKEFGYP